MEWSGEGQDGSPMVGGTPSSTPEVAKGVGVSEPKPSAFVLGSLLTPGVGGLTSGERRGVVIGKTSSVDAHRKASCRMIPWVWGEAWGLGAYAYSDGRNRKGSVADETSFSSSAGTWEP